MKLGKIQKAWIKSLRDNPDRQGSHVLGQGNPKSYTACCLGELLCVEARMKKKKLPFDEVGDLRDDGYRHYPTKSWKRLGLRSDGGSIDGGEILSDTKTPYSSLASANDEGILWSKIADYIEANPEKIFTKSI